MARRCLVSCPLLLVVQVFLTSTFAALVFSPGDRGVIPSWRVQSSRKVGNDATSLSRPQQDTSTWYTVGSKATLMAALVEDRNYTETNLFFSTNLDDIGYAQYQVPWFYRAEFDLGHGSGSHFLLRTNGITSQADIYLNGGLVVDKNLQAGSYGGLEYDITSRATYGKNVLLVRVYPTDYNRDFALGFVDWNPYPPDNGTGIWRDIEIKQTGSVTLSAPRVTTKLDGAVSIHVDIRNLENRSTDGQVSCTVSDPHGKPISHPRAAFSLPGTHTLSLTLSLAIQNPEIWWPAQWGAQPLYTTSCTALVSSILSDSTPVIRFGIRTVSASLNSYNDTLFTVNSQPFQIIGAGYTSDIFLRFSEPKVRSQLQYVLDMGLNTVRLEGKQEHPRFYEMADELGIMILAGWECCDKWEGWTYNDEGSGFKWNDHDYYVANISMRHEATMMQAHPSILGFLVGSDFWPDDRATQIYLSALKAMNWETPIIASASQRGYPEFLGNGGMKMDGPYDWVPPNYWYADQLGAAFGFGSELGAGIGTPELHSLQRFLSPSDLDDLWKRPNKGLYHMSTNVSSFHTRDIYNTALWHRYGAPTSRHDYLLKAQMMDYEATRAQFEAYAARFNAERPATGMIYWMLNNAWPSLHWNLFDYYLHPAGSYFGAKTGSRMEHVAYDYAFRSIYLINRSRSSSGPRQVFCELLSLNGTTLAKSSISASTTPNTSRQIGTIPGFSDKHEVVLLKLELKASHANTVLSRNVYWLPSTTDVLDWDNSTWYHTPVTSFSNFTALFSVHRADVRASARAGKVKLENQSSVPAVFIRLNLVDAGKKDITPVFWSDNYVTLWPKESIELAVGFERGYGDVSVEISGANVEPRNVGMGY